MLSTTILTNTKTEYMGDDHTEAVRHIRARCSLEDALAQGGVISCVTPHATDVSKVTVFVHVNGATRDDDVEIVFSNVRADHAALLVTDQLHVSRQLGTLEEALLHGARVAEIHSHENNNTYSVKVRVADSVSGMMYGMIFTGISADLSNKLAEKFPQMMRAVERSNIVTTHPLHLAELMQEPGSVITAWHPTKIGTYSVHVTCADGTSRQFSSVSQEHMATWVPEFQAGSKKEQQLA
ncbi:hypothetical protein HK100_005565 [Physocladia obscura]|uniref:Uncharacterized protein n=1 Tax=Physocladia obscura TaxID=109957 RepID=A0AAD5TB73_9FUNG|nr:hypothetical protein HK100_005565 [Physocladia obscura]